MYISNHLVLCLSWCCCLFFSNGKDCGVHNLTLPTDSDEMVFSSNAINWYEHIMSVEYTVKRV